MAARKYARKTPAATRQHRKAPETKAIADFHNTPSPPAAAQLNSVTLDAIRGVANKIDAIRGEVARISGRLAALRVSNPAGAAAPANSGILGAAPPRPSTPVMDGIGELEHSLDRLHLELLAFDDSVVV